jgi:hypothetical protein
MAQEATSRSWYASGRRLVAFHWSNFFPLLSPATSADRPIDQRMLRYYIVIIILGRPRLRPDDLLKLALPRRLDWCIDA